MTMELLAATQAGEIPPAEPGDPLPCKVFDRTHCVNLSGFRFAEDGKLTWQSVRASTQKKCEKICIHLLSIIHVILAARPLRCGHRLAIGFVTEPVVRLQVDILRQEPHGAVAKDKLRPVGM